jgi:hypothetical protein
MNHRWRRLARVFPAPNKCTTTCRFHPLWKTQAIAVNLRSDVAEDFLKVFSKTINFLLTSSESGL